MLSKIYMLSLLFILSCGECSCVQGRTKALATLTAIDWRAVIVAAGAHTVTLSFIDTQQTASMMEINTATARVSMNPKKHAVGSGFKMPSSLLQTYLKRLLILFLFYFQYSCLVILTELVPTQIRILGQFCNYILEKEEEEKESHCSTVPKINARILILSALFHVYCLSYVITALSTLTTTQLIWISTE